MKSFLVYSLMLLSSISIIACAHAKMDEVTPADRDTRVLTTEGYQGRIERYSPGNVEYAGLYNNFEFKATLLNSNIREAIVWKQGQYYQWNEAQKNEAREKSNQEMSSQTKIFLAFFTPNPKNDNLDSDKTIWRIYLDAGGRRYEGKAVRVRLLLAEMQALYPYMTRWATPYMLTFDVPTAAIEKGKSSLTITGPLGDRTVDFDAL